MSVKKDRKPSAKKLQANKGMELKDKLEKQVDEFTSSSTAGSATVPGMPAQNQAWRQALLQEIAASEKTPAAKKTTKNIEVANNTVLLKNRLSLKKAKKRIWFWVPLFALLIYIGIYCGRLDNYYSPIIKFLPWPAAIINNKVIWLDDLKTQAGLVKKFNYTSNPETVALNHIIEEKIITDDFNSHNLQLPVNLITQQLTSLAGEFGSAQAFYDYLNKTYNITLPDFIEFIIKPYLRRLLLQDYLSGDAQAMVKAQTEAQILRQKIEANEITFEQAAKNYSQDKLSADQGGDLGWFTWGTMLPEFELALRNLKVGEISQPVKTRYGYHLIRLDELNGALPNDSNDINEMGSVHASHIFIQIVDFDNWLSQKKNSAFKLYLLPLKN